MRPRSVTQSSSSSGRLVDRSDECPAPNLSSRGPLGPRQGLRGPSEALLGLFEAFEIFRGLRGRRGAPISFRGLLGLPSLLTEASATSSSSDDSLKASLGFPGSPGGPLGARQRSDIVQLYDIFSRFDVDRSGTLGRPPIPAVRARSLDPGRCDRWPHA